MTECVAGGDPMVEVTFTWGEDEADTLTIGPDCPDDGVGAWYSLLTLPDWAYRVTSAPPSAWVPGDLVLAVIRDVGTVGMTLAVSAGNTADLEDQKAIVEAALSAWPSTLTITITDPDEDPVDLGPWEYQPAIPGWGAITPPDAGMYAAETGIVLTLNPPGSP